MHMNLLSSLRSFWDEYKRYRLGLVGLFLLTILIVTSILAMILIPIDTFKQWHNPSYWTRYPKVALPAWINHFTISKLPEHLILDRPFVKKGSIGAIQTFNHIYTVQFHYDDFPDDFIFNYFVKYKSIPPLLEVSVSRPDGDRILLIRTSLPPKPYGLDTYTFNGSIYSTDRAIKSNVAHYLSEQIGTSAIIDLAPQNVIFSEKPFRLDLKSRVLKGTYVFNVTFYTFDQDDQVISSELILGGKVFGLLGTDELRRDLIIGILWGTPVALFIGLSVAILAVFVGIVYGVVSGYYGRRVDELMMRINDVIYSLPALPFLIILAVSFGKNILLVVLYLTIFGWVGIAKVARSIALQLKTLAYVEAVELMGASRWRVMFRHIMPQITPFALASIALSVPSAILAEAGLSFLGLGDPTLPTWGQLLHDAQLYGAAARGIWWWIIPPGLMIAITGLAFVFIGIAMDAVLNPKMRKA
ncbi:MAG: ABC transporter permease [Nitrososphaerota archaeon]|nr:ABC transporter permease [Nitrososphaerales archaeon]MDW8044622.1 ABC transporter permease [Nitrososphaerota archaeon]